MATESLNTESFLSLRRGSPPPVVIDLRSEESYQKQHIAGSKSIPWSLVADEAIFLAPKVAYLLVGDENNEGLQQTLEWFEQRHFSNIKYTTVGADTLWEFIQKSPDELILTDLPEAQWLDAIEAVFEQTLRPYLAIDQGGIQVISLENSKLFVRYTGACKSCGLNRTETLGLIQRTLCVQLNHNLKVIAAKETE